MLEKLTNRSLSFFQPPIHQRFPMRRNLMSLILGRPYSANAHPYKPEEGSIMLPIGTEDFAKVINRELYFVDKSPFIKEIFDDKGTDVVVITRPRRFGKTINLSMLQHFLADSVHGKETVGLFNGLKISQHPDYMQHQGKYPVISISFKDVKQNTFEDAHSKLYELIINTYNQHNYLEASNKLNRSQKDLYEILMGRKADQSQLENSLKVLTECLFTHHGINPWLLIDEYDTPIQAGYMNHYYSKIIGLMRGLFGAALKTNPYLEKAVITGVMRVAKESLFSGVNNLEVYSLLRDEYAQHFGFTEEEVDTILAKFNFLSKSKEIKEWYNGYQAGKIVIYNPWSIANCIKQNGNLKPYWVNTSDNQLIKDLFKKGNEEFKKDFGLLIANDPLDKAIDEHVVFSDLDNDPMAIWSLLLMSGYLKGISKGYTEEGLEKCELAIPNMEVMSIYKRTIKEWLSNGKGIEWYDRFIESVLNGQVNELEENLQYIMLQTVSSHDVSQKPEAFYQGLFIGFTLGIDKNQYEIKSNRESGYGRYDIAIIPKSSDKLAIVFEFKSVKLKKFDEVKLLKVANEALKQINELSYETDLHTRGITQVCKIGVAFSGKRLKLASDAIKPSPEASVYSNK